jgi:sugar (pentulose or hexulose) kinase
VRPEARAQFTGLSQKHTRADLLRATYEGVMFSALDCYAQLPTPVTELKLGGGGARSHLWAQIFADGLGAPVIVVEGEEFGAKGAVLNAGVAVGLYASFDEAAARTIRPTRRYEPNLRNMALYRELFALYQATTQAMFPVWAARDAMQRQMHEYK